MNREIKFRIPLKCSCGKKGFDFISWNGQFFESDHVTPCCADDKHEIVGEPQQYTGRKDKNGKEAYHHDIVKSKHYGVGEIVWQGNGWVVICSGMAYSLNYGFVIIGNRHQHAKLLEGKT